MPISTLDGNRLIELGMEYGVKAVLFLILLLITWIVAAWARNLVLKVSQKRRLDPAVSSFLAKLVQYTILVLGVVSGLGTFGVHTASFAAVLAATGFALGMALQGTLGNFASGVMILVFKPFKVGDYISVSGTSGTVANIDLFSVELDTPDNRRIIVPNGSVFGQQIENISFHSTRRVDVSVGTDYSADIDSTRQTLLAAATSLPQVLKSPEPAVVLTGLGASSIDWAVRVWVKAEDFWPVSDELTRTVKYALDKANIGIPFPQVDVNFDSEVATLLSGRKSQGEQPQNTVM